MLTNVGFILVDLATFEREWPDQLEGRRKSPGDPILTVTI